MRLSATSKPCSFRGSRAVTLQHSRPNILQHVTPLRIVQVFAAEVNSIADQSSQSVLYSTQLKACESDGDWLRTVELLTETRLLKVQLDFSTQEAAVRTLASGQCLLILTACMHVCTCAWLKCICRAHCDGATHLTCDRKGCSQNTAVWLA